MAEIDPELAAALQAALDADRTHVIDLGSLGQLDIDTGQVTHPTYVELSDALHRSFWLDNSGGRFIPDEPRRPYFASMRQFPIDADRSALGQPNPAVESVRRQTPHAWGFEPDRWKPTRGYRIRAWLGRAWWWVSGLRIVHRSRVCDWCGEGDG